MRTWQRITDRLRREWSMAGALGRLALLAAPLLLATTLLLAAIVGTGYYEFVTFGQGGAPELPTAAADGVPWATVTATPIAPELRGGVTRHAMTVTPEP